MMDYLFRSAVHGENELQIYLDSTGAFAARYGISHSVIEAYRLDNGQVVVITTLCSSCITADKVVRRSRQDMTNYTRPCRIYHNSIVEFRQGELFKSTEVNT